MNLKTTALDKLAAHLAADSQVAAILGAGGHDPTDLVFASHADAEDKACFPCLVLDVGRFVFQPFNEEIVEIIDADRALLEVGQLEGEITLFCAGRTKPQRAKLEQALLDVFMQREGAPGVLVLSESNIVAGGTETSFDAHFSFALDDEEWSEEKVLEARRYSMLSIDVCVPVLVARDCPTIEDLILALTRSLDSDTPEEQSLIAEDGSVSEP